MKNVTLNSTQKSTMRGISIKKNGEHEYEYGECEQPTYHTSTNKILRTSF